jgi:hypothetical protein
MPDRGVSGLIGGRSADEHRTRKRPMRQPECSRKVQQRPRTVASNGERQHTRLAGTTAKRQAAPLVRDGEANRWPPPEAMRRIPRNRAVPASTARVAYCHSCSLIGRSDQEVASRTTASKDQITGRPWSLDVMTATAFLPKAVPISRH